MRKKILHKGSCPQPGEEIGLGELPLAQTTNQAVPTGVHPPPTHQTSQVCGCLPGDGKTAQEAESAPGLGKLSRAAIALPLLLIRVYQLTLSPFIGQCCRFTPSCSRYATEAVRQHPDDLPADALSALLQGRLRSGTAIQKKEKQQQSPR